MDILAEALIAFATLIASSLAALVSLAIPALRRFALAILITPPAAVSLYYICGLIPNTSFACGPDMMWGNCSSARAEITGWAIWFVCSLCAIAVGYWGQRVLHSTLRSWFNSAPMGIYRNRPRWSRVTSYPSDTES
jgi:predicted alpha/beta hydrolase